MNKKTENSATLKDADMRIYRAADRIQIYLTAAVYCGVFLFVFSDTVRSDAVMQVSEIHLQVKIVLNVLLYVLPLVFTGLAVVNLCVVVIYGIFIPLTRRTLCGLSELICREKHS